MSTVLIVLSLILQALGMVFLFAAALGVLRFKDPLQRMHASTKAGTIGAGLVLTGVVITMDNLQGIVIGVLTILFLLLTVPVAGHLLGRAAYLSGADLLGLEGEDKDALRGVLRRQPQSLEQRAPDVEDEQHYDEATSQATDDSTAGGRQRDVRPRR